VTLVPFPSPPTTPIGTGEPLGSTQRWSRPLAGFAAHAWFIHRPSASVFVADGWGVTVASSSFRRYDLATGEELARVRTGTAVRCVAWLLGGEELIAATDSRLLRLGTVDLVERRRWERRIPRYLDSMALVDDGSRVVAANWTRPSFGIIDLGTGSVLLRRGLPTMLVVDARPEPLLVGGSSTGGLASIDPGTGRIRRLADTPAAIDAALEPGGAALWLTVGRRAIETPNSSGPGEPSRSLRRWPLDRSAEPAGYLLPAGVRAVRLGARELWLSAKDVLVAIPLPVGETDARLWKPPRNHEIAAFDPDERVAIAVHRDVRNRTAMATAFELE